MLAPTSPPMRGAHGEEGVVRRRGAVVVEPQDHPREVGVVGPGSAERVVHEAAAEKRAVRQVLHPSAAALVAHEDVELAVRPELDTPPLWLPFSSPDCWCPGAPGTATLSVCRDRKRIRFRSNVSVAVRSR